MDQGYQEALQAIKGNIQQLAALTDAAIRNAIDGLKNRDDALARKVIEGDQKIDQLELDIDEACIDLIGRYQLKGQDLRYLTTAMKVNGELERIGDIAVEIAMRTLELGTQPLLKPLIDIPKLAQVAQGMVKMSIRAFLEVDVKLAEQVIKTDNEADHLRNSVQRELIEEYMAKDAATAPRAVQLLLVARFLERMCDYTANIAEEVGFMVQRKTTETQALELHRLK